MLPEQFKNLKIGDKIRKPGRPEQVYTVINNDPPGNIILIPGRITKVAYRPVHPDGWEFDPDQADAPDVPRMPRHATETCLDFEGEIEFLEDLRSGKLFKNDNEK